MARIQAAALDLFEAQGFDQVSIEVVARAAEVGPPTSSDHLPLFATLARARATEAREGATRAS